MYRFFVKPEQIEENRIHITGGDVSHIAQVLRMKAGEEICISDGEKMEYTCRIAEIGREEILAEILYGQESGLELPCRSLFFRGFPRMIRWS